MSRRDLAQRYWDAYEESVEPPAGSAARNLARLRERIAAGEAVEEAQPPGAPRARRAAGLVLLAKPAAISVGIATATLLSIKLAVLGWSQLAAPASQAPTIERVERAMPRGTSEARGPRPEPAGPEAVAGPPPPSSASEPSASRAPGSSAVALDPSRAVDSPRPAPADRLRAEVALMERARAALEQADAQALWRLMDQHARRFPSGALREERQAWQAVAACRLGHPRAAVRAREFLAAHPRSPQADKVRRACEPSASHRANERRVEGRNE